MTMTLLLLCQFLRLQRVGGWGSEVALKQLEEDEVESRAHGPSYAELSPNTLALTSPGSRKQR
jgi:hypothetical protein